MTVYLHFGGRFFILQYYSFVSMFYARICIVLLFNYSRNFLKSALKALLNNIRKTR